MNRREPRLERVASRGRSDTRRWSAELRRDSAFVYLQAIDVYSCFRENQNDLGLSSSEYTSNAGPVRPVCPTNTRRQHLKYSEEAKVVPTTTLGRHLGENFRGIYILLPRDDIILKIFQGRYVLLPRASNTLNIFRGSALTCRDRKNSGWLCLGRPSEQRPEQRLDLLCLQHSGWFNPRRPSEQRSEQFPQLSCTPQ